MIPLIAASVFILGPVLAANFPNMSYEARPEAAKQPKQPADRKSDPAA